MPSDNDFRDFMQKLMPVLPPGTADPRPELRSKQPAQRPAPQAGQTMAHIARRRPGVQIASVGGTPVYASIEGQDGEAGVRWILSGLTGYGAREPGDQDIVVNGAVYLRSNAPSRAG